MGKIAVVTREESKLTGWDRSLGVNRGVGWLGGPRSTIWEGLIWGVPCCAWTEALGGLLGECLTGRTWVVGAGWVDVLRVWTRRLRVCGLVFEGAVGGEGEGYEGFST